MLNETADSHQPDAQQRQHHLAQRGTVDFAKRDVGGIVNPNPLFDPTANGQCGASVWGFDGVREDEAGDAEGSEEGWEDGEVDGRYGTDGGRGFDAGEGGSAGSALAGVAGEPDIITRE
jgi:hypothetical protein